jgi:RNA polymerase sigma-70 factor (ECF subfamily)
LDANPALDRFLAGIERRAFRMAQIATGNREDALDLVQDAMLKLAQGYGRHDPQEWGALFHRILQSRINDWYRRTRVRHRFRVWFGESAEDDPDPLQSLPDVHTPGPAQRLADIRTTQALESALQALPLRQQQVFLLRVWEGLDVEQTARAMGCSAGSVKTHYSRAVHRLRATLEDHW